MQRRIETARLTLVAATADTAQAAADRGRLAALLDAGVPPSWPPWFLADVLAMFAERLAAAPDDAGWWQWFILLQGGAHPALIGSIGFVGPPDAAGQVTVGYGIMAPHEGKGYAREALAALLDWARATRKVRRVVATTFEGHAASVHILRGAGFRCEGVSPDDADAPDADRQGRGRLMVYALGVPQSA